MLNSLQSATPHQSSVMYYISKYSGPNLNDTKNTKKLKLFDSSFQPDNSLILWKTANKTAKTIFQPSPKLTSCIWQLFTDQRLQTLLKFIPKICPICPFNCGIELKAVEGPSALQHSSRLFAGAISRLSGRNINLAFPYLFASSGMGWVRTSFRQTTALMDLEQRKLPVRTWKCVCKWTQTRVLTATLGG